MKRPLAEKTKKNIRLTNDENQLSFFLGWLIYTVALWLITGSFEALQGSFQINRRTVETLFFILPSVAFWLWAVYFTLMSFFQDSFKQRIWVYLMPLLIVEIMLNLALYLFVSPNFFYSYLVATHTNLLIILYIYLPLIITITAALAIESRTKNALLPLSDLLDD